MLDKALGRLSTQGILIYIISENNTIELNTKLYTMYFDIFVKKGNRAWRYGLGGEEYLVPNMEIPLHDLTKMMLWDNAQVIRL